MASESDSLACPIPECCEQSTPQQWREDKCFASLKRRVYSNPPNQAREEKGRGGHGDLPC